MKRLPAYVRDNWDDPRLRGFVIANVGFGWAALWLGLGFLFPVIPNVIWAALTIPGFVVFMVGAAINESYYPTPR